MVLSELQLKAFRSILEIENKDFLITLNDFLVARSHTSDSPSFYDLPKDLQEMVGISRQQIKEGKVISAQQLRDELKKL